MPPYAPTILVLSHDVSDPALRRRVAMLRAGGASVKIAGFRRSDMPLKDIDGCAVTDFGRTQNAAFVDRILSVIKILLSLGQYRALFDSTDIVIARNLEMLAIATRGRGLRQSPLPVIYEVLDIHRLLLRKDIIGKFLRMLEGWLSTKASAVITSSPAFITEYFNKISHVRLPIRLVENKLLTTGVALPAIHETRSHDKPWRIGWFGILRCRQSLHLLSELLRMSNGTIEVVLRGKPARDQLDQFDQIISSTPGMTYGGPYNNPDDLADMYGDVHFAWAIDMFEVGFNSSWLLPNRLYEGCYYEAVPLAVNGVETSHFLETRGIGVTFSDLFNQEMVDFFRKLTPETYDRLAKAVKNVPKQDWLFDHLDCQELVAWLRTFSKRADRQENVSP